VPERQVEPLEGHPRQLRTKGRVTRPLERATKLARGGQVPLGSRYAVEPSSRPDDGRETWCTQRMSLYLPKAAAPWPSIGLHDDACEIIRMPSTDRTDVPPRSNPRLTSSA